MLIIYTGEDEVIVTTTKREEAMLNMFFAPETGRNIEDYEAEKVSVAVILTSSIHREY